MIPVGFLFDVARLAQTHLVKTLSHYTQFGASYTYSHSLDEQSDVGLFFTGSDPNHLRDSYASADCDRTNIFQLQYLAQLPREMRAAVLANARSRIAFQLPQADAVVLAKGHSELTADDFMALGQYEIYASLFVNGKVHPEQAIKITVPYDPWGYKEQDARTQEDIDKRQATSFGLCTTTS